MFISRAYRQQHDRQIALWLFACAVTIYAMILLGGVTRLTESGLSMVEWRPIMGIVPPMGDQAWEAVFAKYRQFPEYQKINQGMSLAEFKRIFMYEYLHRVLGRLIGLMFLLPLLFFAFSGRLKPGLGPRLGLLFVLGGGQGLLGWYMVQSGLVDRPSVSQYRLAAHLGLAVALYAAIVWTALSLWSRTAAQGVASNNGPGAPLARAALPLAALVYLMMLSGALVAGTDAGFSHPTWPRMGPGFVPEGLYTTTPAWLAAFEDVTTIQFNHRMFAYLLLVLVGAFALRLWARGATAAQRATALLLLAVLVLQVLLGISTLLSHVAVPIAAAHQAGAVLLLTVLLLAAFQLRHGQR